MGKEILKSISVYLSEDMRSFIQSYVKRRKIDTGVLINEALDYCESNIDVYIKHRHEIVEDAKQAVRYVYRPTLATHTKLEKVCTVWWRDKSNHASYVLYCWAFDHNYKEYLKVHLL